MSISSERPLGPMLPTEDGYLEYVAMENEMTGAFSAVTEKNEDIDEIIYHELYGFPMEPDEKDSK